MLPCFGLVLCKCLLVPLSYVTAPVYLTLSRSTSVLADSITRPAAEAVRTRWAEPAAPCYCCSHIAPVCSWAEIIMLVFLLSLPPLFPVLLPLLLLHSNLLPPGSVGPFLSTTTRRPEVRYKSSTFGLQLSGMSVNFCNAFPE